MPQFRPFRWMNLILWTSLSLSLMVFYLDKILIPQFLTLQVIRTFLSK